MEAGEPFIDYYELLGVEWDCDARTLEYAYRQLAKMYHPDNSGSADVTKFKQVIAAYRALRDPDDRAAYDLVYAANSVGWAPSTTADDEAEVQERAALSDADVHEKILRLLYRRRREHAQDPGVPQFSIQEMLSCTDAVFEFHEWYLKAKGFIARTEQGTLAITIEGVDQVISTSRTKKAEKLRLTKSSDSPD
jgi:curved DNA-binding protein